MTYLNAGTATMCQTSDQLDLDTALGIMVDGYTDILDAEIRAMLMHDRRIRVQGPRLRTALVGRRLLLDGEVDDLPSKRIAANLARQLIGDRYSVDDRLRVRGPAFADAVLRDAIAMAVLSAPTFRGYNILTCSPPLTELLRGREFVAGGLIRVEAARGVVTLTGQVSGLVHRRLAEVLAWWVDGCQRVDNLLEVFPPAQDGDGELTAAVRAALHMDPRIDGDKLQVAIEAGVVELSGRLLSEEQGLLAAGDVWAVPGVWEVYNRIEATRALT